MNRTPYIILLFLLQISFLYSQKEDIELEYTHLIPISTSPNVGFPPVIINSFQEELLIISPYTPEGVTNQEYYENKALYTGTKTYTYNEEKNSIKEVYFSNDTVAENIVKSAIPFQTGYVVLELNTPIVYDRCYPHTKLTFFSNQHQQRYSIRLSCDAGYLVKYDESHFLFTSKNPIDKYCWNYKYFVTLFDTSLSIVWQKEYYSTFPHVSGNSNFTIQKLGHHHYAFTTNAQEIYKSKPKSNTNTFVTDTAIVYTYHLEWEYPYDVVVTKIDSTGNIIDTIPIKFPKNEKLQGLIILENGLITLTSNFKPINKEEPNLYIKKYDNSFNLEKTYTLNINGNWWKEENTIQFTKLNEKRFLIVVNNPNKLNLLVVNEEGKPIGKKAINGVNITYRYNFLKSGNSVYLIGKCSKKRYDASNNVINQIYIVKLKFNGLNLAN